MLQLNKTVGLCLVAILICNTVSGFQRARLARLMSEHTAIRLGQVGIGALSLFGFYKGDVSAYPVDEWVYLPEDCGGFSFLRYEQRKVSQNSSKLSKVLPSRPKIKKADLDAIHRELEEINQQNKSYR